MSRRPAVAEEEKSAAASEPVAERLSCSQVLRCSVEQLMTSPGAFADTESPLRAAAQAMVSQGVGSLILLGPDGPSAIVTERDLVTALAEERDPDSTWAVEVASEDLVTLSPEESVQDAIEAMVSYGVHHLPVRSRGEVVGMISASNILAALGSSDVFS